MPDALADATLSSWFRLGTVSCQNRPMVVRMQQPNQYSSRNHSVLVTLNMKMWGVACLQLTEHKKTLSAPKRLMLRPAAPCRSIYTLQERNQEWCATWQCVFDYFSVCVCVWRNSGNTLHNKRKKSIVMTLLWLKQRNTFERQFHVKSETEQDICELLWMT